MESSNPPAKKTFLKKKEDPNTGPSEIVPSFYVSNCHDAYSLSTLQKINTSHI
jgi:hypothetical protein